MNIYSGHTERALIELLQQNDTTALSTLYYAHVKQLKYFIQKAAKSPSLAFKFYWQENNKEPNNQGLHEFSKTTKCS